VIIDRTFSDIDPLKSTPDLHLLSLEVRNTLEALTAICQEKPDDGFAFINKIVTSGPLTTIDIYEDEEKLIQICSFPTVDLLAQIKYRDIKKFYTNRPKSLIPEFSMVRKEMWQVLRQLQSMHIRNEDGLLFTRFQGSAQEWDPSDFKELFRIYILMIINEFPYA
jgi:hypothetical protein